MSSSQSLGQAVNAHAGHAEKSVATDEYRIWIDDAASFSTHKVQAIRHNFDRHPLLQLDELAKLAKALAPTKQCRFIVPGATQASAFVHKDEDAQGRSLDEVFRRIEEPGSWVALYNVETHPPYAKFLEEVVATVRPLVEREQPGMFNVGGFIFISAPPSVTPFHIDRENNFWLQARGRKTMSVWDPTDRDAVSAVDREQFILYEGLKNVRLKEEFRSHAHDFDVGPGDGVYFPSTSPHMTRCDPGWAVPGDGVSVSIGVVFYTAVTRRTAYVHAWNQFLRHRGLTPVEPNESVWLDRLKYPFGRALVWYGKTFLGYKPCVGF